MAEGNVERPECLHPDFISASSFVRANISKLSEEYMLKFYGFYKQATEGQCVKPKPSWYRITEKQKWEAWSSLKNMTKEAAMTKYVELLDGLDASWKENTNTSSGSWVHHSCLKNEDEEISDGCKTIFDWVKEDNLTRVKTSVHQSQLNVNGLDNNGMSLLHWASDRGSLEIVKYFVESLKADVNIRDADGQTPLHYAASCGHKEVVKFLVNNGADVNVLDNDSQTPSDVANNPQISEMLAHFLTA